MNANNNDVIANEVSDSDESDLYDDSAPLSLNNTWVDNEYESANWEP